VITPLVDSVISSNPEKAAEYRAGRDALIGFFIGQVMRQSGGRANPELVRELLEERLGPR
jgi:Asp-tRNA(Asn)/Glu-tRNA(Gln) amidotransferase B subunit